MSIGLSELTTTLYINFMTIKCKSIFNHCRFTFLCIIYTNAIYCNVSLTFLFSLYIVFELESANEESFSKIYLCCYQFSASIAPLGLKRLLFCALDNIFCNDVSYE